MKLTNADKVKQAIFKILKDKKTVAMDLALAALFENILSDNPVEDGHAHEAWLSALERISGEFDELDSVAGGHDSKRSGDATAKKYARASLSRSDRTLTVVISNNLPFVRKLEYGIPITVGDESGNKGVKTNPVKRPPQKGPLYGGREKGSGGLLVFEQGGKIIKTKVARPTNTGFVSKAIDTTVKYLKSQGQKKVKRRK